MDLNGVSRDISSFFLFTEGRSFEMTDDRSAVITLDDLKVISRNFLVIFG